MHFSFWILISCTIGKIQYIRASSGAIFRYITHDARTAKSCLGNLWYARFFFFFFSDLISSDTKDFHKFFFNNCWDFILWLVYIKSCVNGISMRKCCYTILSRRLFCVSSIALLVFLFEMTITLEIIDL